MTDYRTGSGVLVKIWVPTLGEVEPDSLRQLDQMGSLPFVHRHIAVMPDVHLGKGAVIGSVVPALDAAVPNIVGVDIGCGISAYWTGIRRSELTEAASSAGMSAREFWKRWESQVRRDVPTGFSQHRDKKEWKGFDTTLRAAPVRPLMEEKARRQLGTLGGGNHFIEAQYDDDDRVWFMVHSGSRHTGLRIAEHYDREADKLLERTHTSHPPNLAFLPKDDGLFHDYLHDMEWAVSFALENRWVMLERAYEAFLRAMGKVSGPWEPDSRRQMGERIRAEGINIHHNFARRETHFGREVIVHRKGATSARTDEVGIIPGSMGANSYIVRGRGSVESFTSCSHGAGRAMSRTRARKTIEQGEYEKSLSHTFTTPSRGYVDEAPQSYKNVDEVVRNQLDLVEVVHVLRPIITVKGDPRAAED